MSTGPVHTATDCRGASCGGQLAIAARNRIATSSPSVASSTVVSAHVPVGVKRSETCHTASTPSASHAAAQERPGEGRRTTSSAAATLNASAPGRAVTNGISTMVCSSEPMPPAINVGTSHITISAAGDTRIGWCRKSAIPAVATIARMVHATVSGCSRSVLSPSITVSVVTVCPSTTSAAAPSFAWAGALRAASSEPAASTPPRLSAVIKCDALLKSNTSRSVPSTLSATASAASGIASIRASCVGIACQFGVRVSSSSCATSSAMSTPTVGNCSNGCTAAVVGIPSVVAAWEMCPLLIRSGLKNQLAKTVNPALKHASAARAKLATRVGFCRSGSSRSAAGTPHTAANTVNGHNCCVLNEAIPAWITSGMNSAP